jgi:predicted nuclease of predicted toxin-antitoxin system
VKFKIDENLPVEAAGTLRDAGFDAETIRDEDLSGADDEIVASMVRSEGRILLTLDLDFANIQAYPSRIRELSCCGSKVRTSQPSLRMSGDWRWL